MGAGASTGLGDAFIQSEENWDGPIVQALLIPDLVYYPMSHDFGNVAEGQVYHTSFQIWNGGTDLLTWSLGIVDPWISPFPTNGDSINILDKDTITVSIDTTGLSLGVHTGFVSISANDGGGLRYFNIQCNVSTNNPPNTPTPLVGPTVVEEGIWYNYTTSATDPDNDYIKYGIDADNDDIVDIWGLNYYPSGNTMVFGLKFGGTGALHLRVIAEDTHGARSGFSTPLVVTVTEGNDAPNKPSTPTGPSTGTLDTSYTFSTSAIDNDGDQIKYGWDWDGNGIVDEWTGYVNSGQSVDVSHSWANPGTYHVKVVAKDTHGAESDFSIAKTITIVGQSKPNKPSTPDGASTGKAGVSYSYTTSTTDANGDNIYYLFDWDDGTDSGWIGPYTSGQIASSSHIWSAQGSYQLKVKAKDDPNGDGDPSDGIESLWSDPLAISMPKTHALFQCPWFIKFQHLRQIFQL